METFDITEKPKPPHPAFKTMLVGILIVTFGLLFMLHNMNVIEQHTWRIIFSWPMLLVAVGVVNLAERKYSWGAMLIIIGGLFLFNRYYGLPYNLFSFLWPVVIIIVGLTLIFSNTFKFNRHRPDSVSSDGDFIDETAIFSGSERTIHSKNFRGGKVVSIFGGSKIDLTQCQLQPGENSIEMVAIFGGTTLLVPNDWNVKVEISNVFGGFADKRNNLNVDFNKTLYLRGVTIFGGGELKSF